jgi:hypothetical protein
VGAADVAGDSVGGEMNEELKTALDKYGDMRHDEGRAEYAWYVDTPSDADILAAEAAVVAIFEAEQRKVKSLLKLAQEQAEAAVANKALFEARETVAKQLAEALAYVIGYHVCDNCLADYNECEKHDCKEGSVKAAAALAAYEALEAKG